MRNDQSPAPLLEVAAVFILVVAIFQKLVAEGRKILDSTERFLASIWPVVFYFLTLISAGFLLYCLGMAIFRKWKEYQKRIFDLNQVVAKKDETIQSKNQKIEELLTLISTFKGRNNRLKDGIARYHRLLMRLQPAPIVGSQKVNEKMEHTLANILQDFGSGYSDQGRGLK